MRIAAILVGAVLVLPARTFAEEAAASSAKPVIFCAQAKHDFGKVIQGKPVEHTYVIENKGTATLNIVSVQPSCGCTTAPITQNQIEPGKSAEIKAKFDSTRFEGVVHKTINVSSNDPQTPGYQLELTGTIVKLYETIPNQISFQRVNKNTDFETQMTLKGNEGRKPKITSVAVEGEQFFDARFVKKPDADEYVIFLKLKPGSEPHFVNGTLVVNLEDPDLPSMHIPFHGQISGDVSFFPPKLNFGKVKPNDIFPRKVLLTIDNPQVTIESVSIDPPLFTTTMAPRSAAPAPGPEPRPGPRPEAMAGTNATEVQIKVKQDAPAGDVSGNITIKTNSKDQAVITIPINGTIITQ
ncbi:MAG: DUF1573 domain-containing protein [Acidobacteria bacterium]|nr:DUF1573 domain-containing protein [Acidobacteriota bacterium]